MTDQITFESLEVASKPSVRQLREPRSESAASPYDGRSQESERESGFPFPPPLFPIFPQHSLPISTSGWTPSSSAALSTTARGKIVRSLIDPFR